MSSLIFDKTEYRVHEGAVEKRPVGERRWQRCSLQSLLSFDADSKIWEWLKRSGIRRPPPSGPTQPEDERENTKVTLRLEPEVAKDLDALAREDRTTKSATVGALVRREVERRRK